MRFRAFVHAVKSWLGWCGEACCVGRSQAALTKTLERDRRRASE